MVPEHIYFLTYTASQIEVYRPESLDSVGFRRFHRSSIPDPKNYGFVQCLPTKSLFFPVGNGRKSLENFLHVLAQNTGSTDIHFRRPPAETASFSELSDRFPRLLRVGNSPRCFTDIILNGQTVFPNLIFCTPKKNRFFTEPMSEGRTFEVSYKFSEPKIISQTVSEYFLGLKR